MPLELMSPGERGEISEVKHCGGCGGGCHGHQHNRLNLNFANHLDINFAYGKITLQTGIIPD